MVPLQYIYLNDENMSNQKYPVKEEDIFDQIEIDEEYNKEVFNLAYAEVKQEHLEDFNLSQKILDVDQLVDKILSEREYKYSQ